MANCCDNNKFLGTSHFGESGPLVGVQKNIQSFIKWGFLNIGAWQDVSIGLTDIYGNDMSALRQSEICEGQWCSFRKNWVMESGVVYSDIDGSGHSPVDPEIYVDGFPVTSGYELDWENGCVIISGIPPMTVSASYSFAFYGVYIAKEAGWWQEIQKNSWNIDIHQDAQCGDWVIGAKHRVQLPAIVIGYSRGNQEPYGLGDCRVNRLQTITLEVITEDKCTLDNTLDALCLQAGRCLQMYNVDDAACSSLPYLELIENFPWKSLRIDNANIVAQQPLDFGVHYGQVNWETRLIV